MEKIVVKVAEIERKKKFGVWGLDQRCRKCCKVNWFAKMSELLKTICITCLEQGRSRPSFEIFVPKSIEKMFFQSCFAQLLQ